MSQAGLTRRRALADLAGAPALIVGGKESDPLQPGFGHWVNFRGRGIYINPVLSGYAELCPRLLFDSGPA